MNFFRCGGGVDTSIVTANAEDVLSPKVIVDADGNPLTGTMANNGAVNNTLNCGGSYTIPKGYHNGSGKVTANSLASQTSANATAAQIASGATAWVNGSKITGNATISKYASGSMFCSVSNNHYIDAQTIRLGFKPSVVCLFGNCPNNSNYSEVMYLEVATIHGINAYGLRYFDGDARAYLRTYVTFTNTGFSYTENFIGGSSVMGGNSFICKYYAYA